MRFNVLIDGKNIKGAYIGKTMRIFREQFGQDLQVLASEKMEDYVQAIVTADDEVKANEVALMGLIVKALTPEFLEKILWVCLYAQNDSLPLYGEWLDSIETYQSVLVGGIEAFHIITGISTTVEPEEEPEEPKTKKKSRGSKS